jgi:hypothetical protein
MASAKEDVGLILNAASEFVAARCPAQAPLGSTAGYLRARAESVKAAIMWQAVQHAVATVVGVH